MVVVFTNEEINCSVISLLYNEMRPLSCFHLWYYLLWLRYLPCFQQSDKSGYIFPRLIYHMVVAAHQVELFLNKIFSLNSVLQIVKFTV